MAAQVPQRLIRRKEVEQRTGLARSTIYDKLRESCKCYDPSFPKPVQLGEKAIAWVEAEIDAWIASKIASSRFQSDSARKG